ncbi:secretory phospholipase A2 receptor-like [Penaeus japonicus]|uniref:secretory phospholipase A2 receptor-like n=1 Tax=Penaeus japonicus TaxID=27405 RepID=UPI001C711AE6|nr:secretory phospholipase A2 receptor-like [Penaeus japonicus]
MGRSTRPAMNLSLTSLIYSRLYIPAHLPLSCHRLPEKELPPCYKDGVSPAQRFMITTMTATARLFLLVCLACSAAGECPAGFTHVGNGCYLFGQDPFVNSEAEDFCLGLGSNLASFESCDDFAHVSRYLEISGVGAEELGFWVGAARVGDKWTWTDTGADLPYGAPLWYPFKKVEDNHACAFLSGRDRYLLPEECNMVALALCKVPLPPSSAEPASRPKGQRSPKDACPEPFVPIGDRCLYVNDNFLTWDAARASCSQLAPGYLTDLAVLDTCDAFSRLVRHLEQRNSTYQDWLWIGARDFEETGAFRWVSGQYVEPGVPLWCTGQPNAFEARQHCAMLWGSSFYYVADDDCSDIRKSVCEVGL